MLMDNTLELLGITDSNIKSYSDSAQNPSTVISRPYSGRRIKIAERQLQRTDER